MACLNRIPYCLLDYPATDVEGDPLLFIKGARIEALFPGAKSWTTVGELAYPDTHFLFEPEDDGQYALRNRILTYSIVDGPVGKCVVVSEPSPPRVFSVAINKAAAPEAAGEIVECPTCNDPSGL